MPFTKQAAKIVVKKEHLSDAWFWIIQDHGRTVCYSAECANKDNAVRSARSFAKRLKVPHEVEVKQ